MEPENKPTKQQEPIIPGLGKPAEPDDKRDSINMELAEYESSSLYL